MTWRKEESVGVNGEGSLGKPWYLSPPSGELERIHNHPFSGGFLEKKKNNGKDVDSQSTENHAHC